MNTVTEIAWTVQISMGRTDILILTLPVHEQALSLHLLQSFYLYRVGMFHFSMGNSSTSFVELISKYFLFDAIIYGVDFKLMVASILRQNLLLYISLIVIYQFPQIFLYIFRTFYIDIMSSANKHTFAYCFPFCIPFISFFCLTHWLGCWYDIEQSGENGYLCFFLILEKIILLLSLVILLAVVFVFV